MIFVFNSVNTIPDLFQDSSNPAPPYQCQNLTLQSCVSKVASSPTLNRRGEGTNNRLKKGGGSTAPSVIPLNPPMVCTYIQFSVRVCTRSVLRKNFIVDHETCTLSKQSFEHIVFTITVFYYCSSVVIQEKKWSENICISYHYYHYYLLLIKA